MKTIIHNINNASSKSDVVFYEAYLEHSKANIRFGLGASTVATGLFAYEYRKYMKAKEEDK